MSHLMNSSKRLYIVKGLLVSVEKASFSKEFRCEFQCGGERYMYTLSFMFIYIIINVCIHYHLCLYTLSYMFVYIIIYVCTCLIPLQEINRIDHQYGGLRRFRTGSSKTHIYIHIDDLFSAHNFHSHRDYRYRGLGGSVLYMYIYFFLARDFFFPLQGLSIQWTMP